MLAVSEFGFTPALLKLFAQFMCQMFLCSPFDLAMCVHGCSTGNSCDASYFWRPLCSATELFLPTVVNSVWSQGFSRLNRACRAPLATTPIRHTQTTYLGCQNLRCIVANYVAHGRRFYLIRNVQALSNSTVFYLPSSAWAASSLGRGTPLLHEFESILQNHFYGMLVLSFHFSLSLEYWSCRSQLGVIQRWSLQ